MGEVLLEIAHEGAHLEVRVVGHEPGRGRLDGQLVDIDGDIANRPREPVPGIEEPARLRRRSRAQLHDVSRGEVAHEAGRELLEQRRLGARQVVLGQPGDVLEELGADGVVEIFRGEALGARGEPVTHVLLESPTPVGLVRVGVRSIAHGHQSAAEGVGAPGHRTPRVV